MYVQQFFSLLLSSVMTMHHFHDCFCSVNGIGNVISLLITSTLLPDNVFLLLIGFLLPSLAIIVFFYSELDLHCSSINKVLQTLTIWCLISCSLFGNKLLLKNFSISLTSLALVHFIVITQCLIWLPPWVGYCFSLSGLETKISQTNLANVVFLTSYS